MAIRIHWYSVDFSGASPWISHQDIPDVWLRCGDLPQKRPRHNLFSTFGSQVPQMVHQKIHPFGSFCSDCVLKASSIFRNLIGQVGSVSGSVPIMVDMKSGNLYNIAVENHRFLICKSSNWSMASSHFGADRIKKCHELSKQPHNGNMNWRASKITEGKKTSVFHKCFISFPSCSTSCSSVFHHFPPVFQFSTSLPPPNHDFPSRTDACFAAPGPCPPPDRPPNCPRPGRWCPRPWWGSPRVMGCI